MGRQYKPFVEKAAEILRERGAEQLPHRTLNFVHKEGNFKFKALRRTELLWRNKKVTIPHYHRYFYTVFFEDAVFISTRVSLDLALEEFTEFINDR